MIEGKTLASEEASYSNGAPANRKSDISLVVKGAR